jgi:hypothetical protein
MHSLASNGMMKRWAPVEGKKFGDVLLHSFGGAENHRQPHNKEASILHEAVFDVRIMDKQGKAMTHKFNLFLLRVYF